MEKAIILFDGFCIFCSKSVKFVMDHDPNGHFIYTPLQSPKGQRILQSYKPDLDSLDTLILLEKGKVYTHSTAVLRIARNLKGIPRWFFPLIVLPPSIRDFFYKVFARYRHKLFGKSEACYVPTEDQRKRFG